MSYRKVYFRIKNDYSFDRGWTSENLKQAFQNETAALFQTAGWILQQSVRDCVSDTVIKGFQSLYLHPMSFSGEVLEDEIPEIEALLKRAKSFECYRTDLYEEYIELSDEEYQALLASRQDEIVSALLEMCSTKRRNLYVTGDIANQAAEKFAVRRICDRDKSGSMANLFVAELFEKLIFEGHILTSPTRNGLGFRTAVKKEQPHRSAG